MNRAGTEKNRTMVSRIRHEINLGWYVECREGVIGPFIPRQLAVEAIEKYKKDKGGTLILMGARIPRFTDAVV